MESSYVERFCLGQNKIVSVKRTEQQYSQQYSVIIEEKEWLIRRIELTPSRWANLQDIQSEIELNVKRVMDGESVAYKRHIGGGVYISITSGYGTVDIRRFFMPPTGDKEVKATRQGVALKFAEWQDMLEIVKKINTTYLDLGTATSCIQHDDHANQLGMMACLECNPFKNM